MRARLLILGRFTHDSQGGLSGVLARLAGLVGLAHVFLERFVYGDGLRWKRVSANRATFHLASQNPMRRKGLHCHAQQCTLSEATFNTL